MKFINLSVFDEALILKKLGEAISPPSGFLPDQSLKAVNCYAVSQDGPHTLLHVAVANWDFHFKFAHAEISGEEVGCFEKLYALESSAEIQELRAELKVDLERQRTLVHLTSSIQRTRLSLICMEKRSPTSVVAELPCS